jgi:hypothetical protein
MLSKWMVENDNVQNKTVLNGIDMMLPANLDQLRLTTGLRYVLSLYAYLTLGLIPNTHHSC